MASSYKGIYNAWDFAYGVNPNAGGALQVISGSTGTGSYTITCSPVNSNSADGKPCTVTTSTPITIGGDSAQETVTPTAVSTNGLGQILITATFTYAHGAGAQVTSGSAGLQEAAVYAASTGGGLVAIDAAWFKATGQSFTNKTALGTYLATFKSVSANVSVLDYSGASGTTAATEALSYTAAAGSAYAATTHVLY